MINNALVANNCINKITKSDRLIRQRRLAYVRSHSFPIQDVQRLNADIHYYDVEPILLKTVHLPSKKAYDTFTALGYINQLKETNYELYRQYVTYFKRCFINQKRYRNYHKHVLALREELGAFDFDTIMLRSCGSKESVLACERRLFSQYCLDEPLMSSILELSCRYDTPKGRRHYSKSVVIQASYFLESCRKLTNVQVAKQLKRQAAQIERSLLTDKMKDAVKKRDHYRCVYCGHSQSDGATLHVDHIFPVSKGGKSVMANLQTLCSDCNLGKGNKIV